MWHTKYQSKSTELRFNNGKQRPATSVATQTSQTSQNKAERENNEHQQSIPSASAL